MGREEVLQGVRQTRFEGLLKRHERGELSQGDAGGVGTDVSGLARPLRDEAPEGLRDWRIGKSLSRRAVPTRRIAHNPTGPTAAKAVN